jgi:hypothetical protein
MRMPVIRGVIDRRLLINYRVDPSALESIIHAPFKPKLVSDYGLAGICLIRLKEIRPPWIPRGIGISSENAAHRIAVEWRYKDELREGVYVLRRDTSSWLNALAGGRVFPGAHHHARFHVRETEDHFNVEVESDDREVSLGVSADVTDCWNSKSIFNSLSECSQFFQAGSLGYSPGTNPRQFQGLELRCSSWQVESLAVRSVRSSFFDDSAVFPFGSVELDCALLMRGIEHEWHSREDLYRGYATMAAGSLCGSGSPMASA